jgi:hypothetical protein
VDFTSAQGAAAAVTRVAAAGRQTGESYWPGDPQHGSGDDQRGRSTYESAGVLLPLTTVICESSALWTEVWGK